MLIFLSMIAFEVLHKEKPQAEGARKTAETTTAMPSNEARNSLPAPVQRTPLGDVPTIMAEIMSPGRGKVELARAFAEYCSECNRQGKTPVPVEAFTEAITR